MAHCTLDVMNSDLPKTVNDIPTPPPTENIGKKIIIFGKATCPDCQRVKKFLAENAIEYEFHDVDLSKEANKWLSAVSDTVPVVIMLDQTVMYVPSNQELFEKIHGTSINQKVTLIEPDLFDVCIVGAGPSGITAAIYAVRKSLKVLVISKNMGGQAALSGDVENYPGFTMITGAELALKFKEEVQRFDGQGLWIKEGVEVTGIEGSEGNFTVKTTSSSYKSKTVIIASGRTPRMLGVKGEKEFLGKGVATCATCDAPLFRGKDVAVVGGGNSALDAAFSLMKLAKTVTIVNLTDNIKGDELLMKNVMGAQNVHILNNSTVTEILGKEVVEGIKVQNTQNHSEEEIKIQGVFIEIGWVPSVDFVPNIAKDKQNQIIVDEFGQTSINGIWASGDVNNLWGEQIVIAAGEGAKVALSVAEHIAKIPHQATSNVHQGA